MSARNSRALLRSTFARHVLTHPVLLTLAFGAIGAAQATQTAAEVQHAHKTPAHTPQKTAPKGKSGADRGIIFVGGHPQSNGKGAATHVSAHPPGPCAPSSRTCSSAGDASSLNPQPIPPGRASKTMSKE